MPEHPCRKFWDKVNGLLCLLDDGGHITIIAHGREYVSVPWEHGVMFVCAKPYHRVHHFSELDDPNADVMYWAPEERARVAEAAYESLLKSVEQSKQLAGKMIEYKLRSRNVVGLISAHACPFCARADELEIETESCGGKDSALIHCKVCGAQGPRVCMDDLWPAALSNLTHEETYIPAAVKAWNMRT